MRAPVLIGIVCAGTFVSAPAAEPSSVKLSATIDARIEQRLREANATRAEPADDAEFCRRIHLDLIGRIPTVREARAFLDDASPDKHAALVDSLLAGKRHPAHFAAVLRDAILPDAGGNVQFRFTATGFETWLRTRLAENKPYDRLVHELVTGTVGPGPVGVMPAGGASPIAFYQLNENKAENAAAAVSRLFLGVRLECAQCHNHPFAQWKQEQFWSFAAFFSGLPGQPNFPVPDKPGAKTIKIPGTERTVAAKFLDGAEPQFTKDAGSRAILADWLVSRGNKRFARAAVNRLWAHFFGLGIVEPIDEMGDENPASHPELLDELARGFVDANFDLKTLIRAIALSRTYRTSSAVGAGAGDEDPHLFARASLRGLSGEQLFDSLASAVNWRDPTPAAQRQFAYAVNGPRSEFLQRFGRVGEKPTESALSILQALALMNGKFTAEATDLRRSMTLSAVADAPFLSTHEKVETLYLAVLSRRPKSDEARELTAYVDSGGPRRDPAQALSDVFWALLNSPEFNVNH